MTTSSIIPFDFEGNKPNVISVPLTKGKVALVGSVDADLLEFKWHAHKGPSGTFYGARAVYENGKQRVIFMHRVILARMLGRDLLPYPLENVDHVNLDGLDNGRENLRLATSAQNQRNRSKLSTNTSGYKGVYFNKRRGKWQANIRIDGKLRYLGLFTTPEEAHAAYCTAAKQYHAEFARLE